ncbi:O-antigen ligase family protein [Methylobacterium sp. Leaf117]|uniref:O-antigen ligase family protein n=1 Tax=Methylobacterium sp. Leaf117 TaxID=1736260 RepID=UPI0006FBEC15|nr:O-antigen ligase family protein [Methylobacterium sp. Leaf117]KQP80965.1 polymerase [Methylobacterium sp. Leaf117]
MASTMAPGAARWQAGAWARIPVLSVLKRLATLLLVAFIFFACFAFSDTSPYDVVAIPTIVLWLCLGLRLHRGMVPLLWLLILYVSAITVALMPFVDQPLPVTWTIQLAYLAITGVFFAMLFSDDTEARMELALKTFVASCLLSSAFGIVGYFGFIPTEDLFYKYGRASGTFQDPNVFGSFLTLGALYLMHGLLLGTSRRPILSSAILMVIVAGIFLSFSRGSWGGTLIAVAVMVGSVYTTTPSARLRRRIVILTVLAVAATAVAIVGLLSIGDTAEMFSKRAAVTQDYDTGETGRFGNQMRGLAMLLDEPLGMGPLRWRLIFALEPHNTYIGSFANGGWLAGVTFIGLVLTTSVVGFRLMRRDTPYRRHAQIVWPALLMFFLQAVQIDIEKWRHVYMMLGMIWGLEAARLRWLAREERG